MEPVSVRILIKLCFLTLCRIKRAVFIPLSADVLLLVTNDVRNDLDGIVYIVSFVPAQQPGGIPHGRPSLVLARGERIVEVPQVAGIGVVDLIQEAHGLVEEVVDVTRRVASESGRTAHGEGTTKDRARPQHLVGQSSSWSR